MGGDRAPEEIVSGARQATEELGIRVVLVGPPDVLAGSGLDVIGASEIVSMDEEPGQAVRRKKDSSLVRAAEAVRDRRACAMVSAGNTGATMASALLRMGRLKGVSRPAIATPIPNLVSHPTLLLDSGANSECTAQMVVQFAEMGASYASVRYGVEEPTVALLSIGEEKSKGSQLVKESHSALEQTPGIRFVGNVEGRDLLHAPADVVVTDGFTGNVALKTLEGSLKFFMAAVLSAFDADDSTKQAASALMPHLLPLATTFDPDNTGGAVLLGVDGVCVISHGSSSARAIVSAIRVAHEAVVGDVVGRLSSKFRN
jgi:glycerol-3-phosphate acyltransferase PlsX